MYYIYILRCKDQSLYTGITNNLERRMHAHFDKLKTGAKYTHAHPPIRLECVFSTETKSDALKLEYRIKQLTKSQKEALLKDPTLLAKVPQIDVSCYTYVAAIKKS